MSKTIMRVEKNKENPYLMLNKTSLNDKKLSWKAKGLHAYLMSLPDDWKIYIEELMAHAKDGRESTTTAVNELIKAGYIKRTDIKDERGRFCGKEYIVYETPLIDSDLTENGKPVNGNANNGKTVATNKELKLNNKKLNNKSVSQDGRTESPKVVEEILENSQASVFYEDNRLLIEETVRTICTDKNIALKLKIGLTNQQIRDRILTLKIRHLDRAINKYQHRKHNVTNTVIYFAKILIESIGIAGVEELKYDEE